MTDIIDWVRDDHHDVMRLLDSLKAAAATDDQVELLAEVKEQLDRHLSVEEKVLYPAVRKDLPTGEEAAENATEEHEQIRRQLHEFEEIEAGTDAFALAVTRLVAVVTQHFGVEEGELLPAFRRSSDDSERDSLGLQYEEAKTKAIDR